MAGQRNGEARRTVLSENILTIALKIKDYDAINGIKLNQANVRIAQAQQDKKFAITFLQEARKILSDLLETINQPGTSRETTFEVYSGLCRVSYLLGEPEKTMEYGKMAKANRDWILKFIEDKDVQKRFLKRRPFRVFERFCKQTKL